ncbi:MAG: hypothetical protein QOF41_3049 [Methylobacteriaceae bacterium]|nr:hypothetical protein [Methylobacteriaceae bacterium]
MLDREEYVILIYVNGVEAKTAVHGQPEYLQAKMFLNMLIARTYKPEYLPRPIPEPGQDWYELTREQFRAYLQFLNRLTGKAPRPE